MADADELWETIVRELSDVVISDGGDVEEEPEKLTCYQDTVSDDIPPSLLSYFETSKRRAARSEKLILQELEDFTASRPTKSEKTVRLLLAPRGTAGHRAVSPDSRDEGLGPGARTIQRSEKEDEEEEEEEEEETDSHRANKEKIHREETRTEEKRRQRHRDFQEKLRKITETEKLRVREVELMGKRAQEKLEEEFLLQQELIGDLQKRVEEERRIGEEEERKRRRRIKEKEGEKKRIKEEEEKRIREEEQKRIKEEEAEKKRIKEEEEKRKREEEQKKRKEEEEKRIREEEQKKRKEEEEKTIREVEDRRKRNEEEEKRIREEEDRRKRKEEEEKRIREEEQKRIKEEGEKKRKEEEEKRIREEEDGRKKEDEIIKRERERMEEQMRRKEEEKRRIEEIQLQEIIRRKRKEEEEEERRIEEEEKGKKDEHYRKMIQEDMRKKEEERKIKETRLREEEEKIKEREKNRKREEEEIRAKDERMTKKMEEEKGRKKKEEKLNSNEENKKKEEERRKEVKTEEKGKKMDEELNKEEEGMKHKMELNDKKEDEVKTSEEDTRQRQEQDMRTDEEEEEEHRDKRQMEPGIKTKEDVGKDKEDRGLTEEDGHNVPLTSSCAVPSQSESSVRPSGSENILSTSARQTAKPRDAGASPRSSPRPLPACLPEDTEQKRLSWMRDCVPWSTLSLQNRSKGKARVRSRRGLSGDSDGVPPVRPLPLLQSTGCRSLREVTTVTLEDLPGCGLASLAQCPRLQSLTLRRCGLRSLEGVGQLPLLCHIDVQENDISSVDCENMASLRVLRLGRNKLTSIHGLSGAVNLSVLDLSHNSISRIAGLESVRTLQTLSLDHNQLISTKGLRDTHSLLHLDCSHNHLVSAEGLENCALLQTLDLRSNSLTEPPSLNNHVLLRELRLDDNSISSLRGLAMCWLPLLHHLSAAENRMSLLSSMSDFVSLTNLDLRFNCISELQNVCDAVDGCLLLQDVHLGGNPLQQELGWRSTLEKALAAGRRRAAGRLSAAGGGEDTDSSLSAPAAGRPLSSASGGGFLAVCQDQLKQIEDLQEQHSRELSNSSAPLDAVRSSCRHLADTLNLAVDHRLAHEHGAGQTPRSAVAPNRNDLDVTSEEKSSLGRLGLRSSETTASSQTAPVSNRGDPDPKSTAAVMIQQRWRKYREKCGNLGSPPTAEKKGGGGGGGDGGGGGGGGSAESGPSDVDRNVAGRAATLIQAFWRGFALRRRLATALAAVTCADSGEDEAFEEVDVDGFVFDEAALEDHWTLPPPPEEEPPPPRTLHGSEPPASPKPPGLFPGPSHCTPPPTPRWWRPKQAWVAGEQVDSTGRKSSAGSSVRSESPASTSVLSGLSARSQKILEEWGFQDSNTALMMLKRAEKMGSKKQKTHRDPSICLALFKTCQYQPAPAGARCRAAPHSKNLMKVCRVDLDLQLEEQTEQTEQVKQVKQVKQWLHTRSDRDPESERFLPEISSVALNGGRVQLVADPAHAERLHHASGLWASSSVVAQPCKERTDPSSSSLGHRRKAVPSARRVTSAPSRKERISTRDNRLQLSGGWGGGKKRDKVSK